MALGKRKQVEQPLFIATADLPAAKSNPYYEAVNKVLAAHQFDPFVEQACGKFYKSNVGRPGLAPGVYFRCLLVGYFEGIDSERGIAWRCADSRSLGLFLGVPLDGATPDHSTISPDAPADRPGDAPGRVHARAEGPGQPRHGLGQDGRGRLDHAGGERGAAEPRPAGRRADVPAVPDRPGPGPAASTRRRGRTWPGSTRAARRRGRTTTGTTRTTPRRRSRR